MVVPGLSVEVQRAGRRYIRSLYVLRAVDEVERIDRVIECNDRRTISRKFSPRERRSHVEDRTRAHAVDIERGGSSVRIGREEREYLPDCVSGQRQRGYPRRDRI